MSSTTALTWSETEQLFSVIDALRAREADRGYVVPTELEFGIETIDLGGLSRDIPVAIALYGIAIVGSVIANTMAITRRRFLSGTAPAVLAAGAAISASSTPTRLAAAERRLAFWDISADQVERLMAERQRARVFGVDQRDDAEILLRDEGISRLKVLRCMGEYLDVPSCKLRHGLIDFDLMDLIGTGHLCDGLRPPVDQAGRTGSCRGRAQWGSGRHGQRVGLGRQRG